MKVSHVFILLMVYLNNFLHSQNTIFYSVESIQVDKSRIINEKSGANIFNYFKNSDLFEWGDENNCEDRANAISILLENWDIPSYKVWVFSGTFLGKDKGELICVSGACWKYHVASAVPIQKGDSISFIVIDPATTKDPLPLNLWADNVTAKPHSYFLLTSGDRYIWTEKGINFNKSTFSKRTKKNYEWTMQGLAGFNGKKFKQWIKLRTKKGKRKVRRTQKKFERLKSSKPNFD